MSQASAKTRADLNLLLLLTALFASLTGIGAGERGLRAVQDVAMVQSAAHGQATVQRARSTVHAVAAPSFSLGEALAWPVWAPIALISTYLPFERRLE